MTTKLSVISAGWPIKNLKIKFSVPVRPSLNSTSVKIFFLELTEKTFTSPPYRCR